MWSDGPRPPSPTPFSRQKRLQQHGMDVGSIVAALSEQQAKHGEQICKMLEKYEERVLSTLREMQEQQHQQQKQQQKQQQQHHQQQLQQQLVQPEHHFDYGFEKQRRRKLDKPALTGATRKSQQNRMAACEITAASAPRMPVTDVCDEAEETEDDESPTAGPKRSHSKLNFGGSKDANSTQNMLGGKIGDVDSMLETLNRGGTLCARPRVSARKENGWLPRHSVRQWCSDVVNSRWFEMVVAFFIITNSIVIGFEADWATRYAAEAATGPFLQFRILNYIFSAVFLFELGLRLFGDSWYTYSLKNPNFGWNTFDSFVVSVGTIEQILEALVGSQGQTSILRIVRVMKLIRVVRVFRVMRFFKDLRVMIQGIMVSMKSLLWALLLLLILMYFVSVCILQLNAELHQLYHVSPEKVYVSSEDYDLIIKFYGSMAATIYTLWMSVLGGIDWADAADPLISASIWLGGLFSFYIALTSLCVLNIVTGVFVENATDMSARDEQEMMMQQLEGKKKWLQEVRSLFCQADADGSGVMDSEEFQEFVCDMRVQSLFSKLGISIETMSPQGLFSLLDVNNKNCVDVEEFTIALTMMHGNAKSIDMARLRIMIMNIMEQVGDVRDRVDSLRRRGSLPRRSSSFVAVPAEYGDGLSSAPPCAEPPLMHLPNAVIG